MSDQAYYDDYMVNMAFGSLLVAEGHLESGLLERTLESGTASGGRFDSIITLLVSECGPPRIPNDRIESNREVKPVQGATAQLREGGEGHLAEGPSSIQRDSNAFGLHRAAHFTQALRNPRAHEAPALGRKWTPTPGQIRAASRIDR